MLITGAVCAYGQSLQQSATGPTVLTPYQVVAGGPHERVWQSVSVDANGMTNRHSYIELATGLNFWNPATRKWEESQEEFQITADGYAIATNGQHNLIVSPDIASPGGAIDYLGPDGQRLVSNPMGLGFRDTTSGETVLIAEVTNCVGRLAGPNVIVFPRAFDTVRAALSYTYTRSGMEQDVILYQQLASPASYGLDPATSVLEIWTEFHSPPQPAITTSDRTADQTLDFGHTRMGRGVAYLLNATNLEPVALQKTWANIDNKYFLVESVPYTTLKPLLDKLQASAGTSRQSETVKAPFPDRTKLVAEAFRPKPKVAQMARIQPGRLSRETGLCLDYQTLNTSQSNYTFKADTTYYLSSSSSVSLSGTMTIEGNTVIKCTNSPNAGLTLNGSLVCATGPYRMAVLTSGNDNTVGETISGSTGSPTNYNGGTYLHGGSGAYQYLRLCYAGTGILGSPAGVWHCQLVRCTTAIVADNSDVGLHNVLFCWCPTAVSESYSGTYLRGEHVSADQVGTFYSAPDTHGYLTNSILTAVTNLGQVGTLQNCATNGSSAGFYQVVGGAAYYLADGSTNRNAGTTNISSALLADLQKKTTYPPIVYSNATLSADTTLGAQAQRDTDIPDLGYHYDPLDYAFGGTTANSNVVFTAGTAVGWFRTSSGWQHAGHGLNLADRQIATFAGTLESPDYWVRCNVVQEGCNGLWQGGYGPGGITGWAWPYITNSPQIVARFTRFSIVAGDGNHYRDDWGWLIANASSCEYYGGSIGYYNGGHHYTNCLFQRTYVGLSTDQAPSSFSMRNCTAFGNQVNPARSNAGTNAPVVIRETSFDSTAVSASTAGVNVTYYDYNAYLQGATNPPAGAHDQVLTNFNWQSGALGNYYLPTNSSLINTGGATADLIGLYHYTTQTNQVKEANSVVDIGYHYVALDSSGKAIDTDGDGIPDYLEDANGNGNGADDPTSWLVYNSRNGLTGGSGLQVFTPLR